MAYDVYLDNVLLPVTPSKIKTEIDNKNKTINLINEGEVNVLKSAGLTKISFSALLPNVQHSFARYPSGFKNASYYLGVLEKYKTSKKPFRLIVSRALPNGSVLFYTNLKVSLEDYDIEDNASEGFDIKVTINLKQYKAYGTKKTNISAYVRKAASTSRDAGAGANTAGSKYTIVSGDTLWNIAKKKLGSAAKWTLIYEANKAVIEAAAKARGRASSSNGHWIFPGTVITIPDGNAAASSASTKRTSGSYKGTGGSQTNPPFTILTNTYGVVKTNFKSWGAVISYYSAYSGKSKGWKIVDSNNRVVEI